MKTTDMQKKQALCEELNMNLNEANELFETETLESMQMAQINGGLWPSWAKLWDVLTKAGTMAAVWDFVKDTFSGTPDPQSAYTIRQGADGTVTIETTGPITETITIHTDSITKNGVYNQTTIIKPTPVPAPVPTPGTIVCP